VKEFNITFMELAIREAIKALKKHDQPFGAVITKGNKVISKAYCTTKKDFDISRHAEMNAIRKACNKLNTFDLSDCAIYSTAEPCLMCFGAIRWTKISELVFGIYNKDTKSFGFSEPGFNKKSLMKYSNSMRIKGGIMRDKIIKIFQEWDKLKDKLVY